MANHHTKDKGDLAVLKVQADLCEQGLIVCTPQTEHALFDIVAYCGSRFWKVQVKFCSAPDGVLIGTCQRTWADKHGNHIQKYADGDFDVLALYCPETDECYYIPWEKCNKRCISLRVTPPLNGAKKYLRAGDFRKFMPL